MLIYSYRKTVIAVTPLLLLPLPPFFIVFTEQPGEKLGPQLILKVSQKLPFLFLSSPGQNSSGLPAQNTLEMLDLNQVN